MAGRLSDLYALLQPDEQTRAGRYRRETDQQRFITARAVLRLLLGQTLRQPPASIRFGVGANKKPFVNDAATVQYNVSHAGDWVLIALGQTPVGIDIERIDNTFSLGDLLANSFGPAEQAFIRHGVDHARAFYGLWTRKEALVKATAKGIDDDFPRIPSLDGTHRIEHSRIGSAADWYVGSFSPAEEYVAAVAYPASVRIEEVRFYDLSESFFEHFPDQPV